MDRTRSILIVSAAALVLAACPASDGDQPTGQDTPPGDGSTPTAQPASPDGDVELTQTCESDLGYTISYPEGWHTNDGEVVSACTLFDPQPIQVEEGTQLPITIAVTIRREPVPTQTVLDEDEATEEVSREQTEVSGHDAWIVETTSTGSGLLPEGTANYRYVIDVDGETLIVETYDEGRIDFDEKRQLLDEMVRTMELR